MIGVCDGGCKFGWVGIICDKRNGICIYSLLDVFVFFGLKWMVVNWVIVYLYVIGNKSEYILFFNIKLFNILIKWSLFEVIYLLYMDFDNFDFR